MIKATRNESPERINELKLLSDLEKHPGYLILEAAILQRMKKVDTLRGLPSDNNDSFIRETRKRYYKGEAYREIQNIVKHSVSEYNSIIEKQNKGNQNG